MKPLYILLFFTALSISCTHKDSTGADNDVTLAVANNFINTFYSFNSDSLKLLLSQAPGSHPGILYYQKWAECAHYQVVKRGDFIQKNDSIVICPITVKDDLMAALQIDFNVTDSFHVAIRDGQIRSVTTSSNDPEEYYKAKEWVKQSRPDYIQKACEGIWEGGPTPCECVLGMVKGFEDYTAGKEMK